MERFWRGLEAVLKSVKTHGKYEGKSIQEEADMHKLYLLLAWKDVCTGQQPQSVELAVERLGERAAAMPIDALRSSVKSLVANQVEDLIGPHDHPEFRLAVRPSVIPDAGRGVFMDGNAALGQVVALMPGLIYSKFHTRDIPGYPSFGKESDFLMSRYDGHVVDSRAWEHFRNSETTMRHYNAKRRKRSGLDHDSLLDRQWFHRESRTNMYAVGHLINHPEESVAPNVMAAPVDWSDTNVRKVPWSLYWPVGEETGEDRGVQQDPVGQQDGCPEHVLPGLAFVTTRPIEDGEELLVNYRLNPAVLGGLPKWYTAVNEEEDARRWT